MLRADSPLFKPVQIGHLRLPNRFLRSATYEGRADLNGHPQPTLLSLIENLSFAGVGLIVPGFVSILRNGQAFPNQTCFYDDSTVQSLELYHCQNP
jgi:2,4-dienoyl-CoA reductase-like NADH-dependent reductase (Old Yellow Enzyme family)